MTRLVWIALVLVACDSKKEKPSDDVKDMVEEASVDFARKQVPELERQLASEDPGAASSGCAVVKPDLPAIRKADRQLADKLERLCGRDLAVRSLTVFVDKAEAARKAAPDDKLLMECSGWDIFAKHVPADEPALAALRARFGAACPGK